MFVKVDSLQILVRGEKGLEGVEFDADFSSMYTEAELMEYEITGSLDVTFVGFIPISKLESNAFKRIYIFHLFGRHL